MGLIRLQGTFSYPTVTWVTATPPSLIPTVLDYVCVCVCVCVRERETERERQRERKRERETERERERERERGRAQNSELYYTRMKD